MPVAPIVSKPIPNAIDLGLAMNAAYSPAVVDHRPIRFASVPRTGTRTLLSLGLLGEVPGKHHSKVTDYPGYQGFRWLVVERDPKTWYDSWWAACVVRRQMPWAQLMKFGFTDKVADLAHLHDRKFIGSLPLVRPLRGLHAWIPADFALSYGAALDKGADFYQYCYQTVMDGVACERVPLASLDTLVASKGLTPAHINPRII